MIGWRADARASSRAWPDEYSNGPGRTGSAARPHETRSLMSTPDRRRHTFAIRTLRRLVADNYRQAARLTADTGPDARLAFTCPKADP